MIAPPLSATTMTSVEVLGYADDVPCTYLLDGSYPLSLVSPAFLYKNSLHPQLAVGGRQYASLTVSVPSQGGYYSSSAMHLLSSPTCKADIVLGAEWLKSCRALVAVNVLLSPSREIASNLPDGHMWTADGTCPTCATIDLS